MERFITRRIKKLGLQYETDTYGNIYVTKGQSDLYPTMVCHIDTVHNVNENVIVQKIQNKLYAFDHVQMQQYGIGGDDKVGIYITLQLLEHFENFKAVFFKDEEVGCVGSRQADFTFFDDSTIVLECDRKGISDFVNNIGMVELFNKELEDDISAILNHYKRKVTTGGMTDVQQIAEHNNVMVANMSCGYYEPHSDNEYIDIEDVYNTCLLCFQIFKATKHKRYEMTRTKKYKPWYNSSYKSKSVQAINHYDPYLYEEHDSPTIYSKEYDADEYFCYNCGAFAKFDDMEGTIHCETCNAVAYPENIFI
jgi:putative aminopeptidase FrvX